MAQTLYIRETNGDRFILNQREKYGDVQIASLNRDKELQRGGGVIADTELSGLIRGFLDSRTETAPAADSSRKLTINVTESMIQKLGDRATTLMQKANASKDMHIMEDYQLDGILDALSTLGIASKIYWNGEKDLYTAIDIADQTFYVKSGPQLPVCPSGDFSCPYWTQGGCTLEDPANECDDYMYYHAEDGGRDAS